jgi:NAD(P)-dependent dehydrogenase (short-subunit alcohol dehydrogenase family)
MASRLDGKVAIVTGAGSGIGRAAAQLFSAEGACVVCADLNEEGAVQTLKGMPKIDEKTAIALKVDVTVPTQVEHMVAHTIKTFGRLDVLYANAGIGESCNAIELTLEQWNRMITVNLTSVWLSAKYSLPHMIAGGGGSIINQSSSAGLMAVPAMPHYCAAKTGVIGLTRQLALDYGPQGIRVNAICPSAIPTPLMDSVWTKRARDAGSEMTIAELEAATAAKLPLRRLGVLADCAQLALFLASDESSWITGAAIPLDGGLAAT